MKDGVFERQRQVNSVTQSLETAKTLLDSRFPRVPEWAETKVVEHLLLG